MNKLDRVHNMLTLRIRQRLSDTAARWIPIRGGVSLRYEVPPRPLNHAAGRARGTGRGEYAVPRYHKRFRALPRFDASGRIAELLARLAQVVGVAVIVRGGA